MYKKLFLLIAFLGLTTAAVAQVVLSASTDKTALSLDDELTLNVEVTGISGNVTMPQLPSLPAFNVYSREVEQSTINGRTTLLFRYTMVPRFVGNAEIGPVTFSYNNQTYRTDPITVRVYRGNAPQTTAQTAATHAPIQADIQPNLPPLEAALSKQAQAKAGEPFFLVAAVSNRTPYVNEAVSLAVRFYYSRSFYDAPYQKPTVSNLFIEDEGSVEGKQTIGNTVYHYQEQRYQLTAAEPGKATIGPAAVRYKTGSSPFAAFDRLFGGAAVSPDKTVLSAPITLSVRELPAGKPASFYGAVGSGYTLSAQASSDQVEAGQAVNLTVTVKGPGNLKATQNLTFPALDGFKIYPAAPESGRIASSTRSYKTFKAVLVPAASGIYTIPSFSWSYFNPDTHAYKTLQTDPLTVTVVAATKTESGFNFSNAQSSSNGVQALTNDILYLKMTHAPAENFLVKAGQLYLVNIAAIVLLVITFLFAVLGRKKLARQKIWVHTKAQLKKASSAQEISDATCVYLAKRLDIHTGSLPLKDILAAMSRHGIAPATSRAFAVLWRQLEAQRFAPAGFNAPNHAELAAYASRVLKQIEEELK